MFLEKLRKVVEKNPSLSEVINELHKLLIELNEELKPLAIIITGSIAKGEFVMGLSDIDIVLIINEAHRHSRFLLRVIRNINVEISIYSLDEVKKAIEIGNQFITTAINSGIVIKGLEIIEELRMHSTRYSQTQN